MLRETEADGILQDHNGKIHNCTGLELKAYHLRMTTMLCEGTEIDNVVKECTVAPEQQIASSHVSENALCIVNSLVDYWIPL